MASQKSLKKNYIYNLSYQIMLVLTPLITTPYLSRVLGPEGIGTYSYTASIVSYFVMFAALGTMYYGNREISFLQQDRKRRSQTFWELKLFSLFCVLVCLAVYGFFLRFVHNNQALYLVQIISILSVATDITWLLQGMEEFGKIIGRNFVVKILILAFIFLAVKDESDLLLYVAGITAMELICHISVWGFLPQFVDKPDWKSLRPFRHFSPAVALFIPTIATTVYTVLDKSMLGFFTDTNVENGYYEQALKLIKTVLTIVTALGAVMVPRIGAYFSENRKDEVTRLLYESYRFIWFLGLPLCFGIIGSSANLVPWFYGPGFEKVIFLLCILSVQLPIIGLSHVTGVQYLITTKREGLFTRSVMIGAASNFALNLLLIPRLYSIGASIASIIAEAIVTGVQLYFIRKELSIGHIFKQSIKYLIACVVMLAVLLVESYYFPSSWIFTTIMIASGGMTYFLVLFILRDDFMLHNAHMLIHKMKKRAV